MLVVEHMYGSRFGAIPQQIPNVLEANHYKNQEQVCQASSKLDGPKFFL